MLFDSLTKNEIRKIVDIQIRHVQKLLKDKEIILDVDDEAKDWLAKLGYDVTYGQADEAHNTKVSHKPVIAGIADGQF